MYYIQPGGGNLYHTLVYFNLGTCEAKFWYRSGRLTVALEYSILCTFNNNWTLRETWYSILFSDTILPCSPIFIFFHNSHIISEGIACKIGLKHAFIGHVHQSLITCTSCLPSILKPAGIQKLDHKVLLMEPSKTHGDRVSYLGFLQHQHFEGNMYPILLMVASSGSLPFHSFHKECNLERQPFHLDVLI